MSKKKSLISTPIFLMLLIIFQSILNHPLIAQFQKNNSDFEFVQTLAKPEVEKVYGQVLFENAYPYYDLEGNIAVLCIEFYSPINQNQITAIFNFNNHETIPIMIWLGLPLHQDPIYIARSRENIFTKFGVQVSNPIWIVWFNKFELWAIYPQVDSISGNHVASNLFDGRVGTFKKEEVNNLCSRILSSSYSSHDKMQPDLFNKMSVLKNNFVPGKYLENDYHQQKILIPPAINSLEIELRGNLDNHDLYLNWNGDIFESSSSYKFFLEGYSQHISIPNPEAGAWQVLLHGQNNVDITISISYITNVSYVLDVRPEKLEYSPQNKVVFTGSLKTSSGQPVPNYRIGVDDSLVKMCMLGPYTDSNGKFRYETTIPSNAEGVYAMTFYGSSSTTKYNIVQVKVTGSFQIQNPNKKINLGTTSNISDINLPFSAKVGSGIPTPNSQELLNTVNDAVTFIAGTAQNTVVDFVSNPVNDVALAISVGCAVGVWTGVGTIPCAIWYAWTIEEFAKSAILGAVKQSIDMSNELTKDEKTFWKNAADGADCVAGIILLDPKDTLINNLGAVGTGWTCGQALAGIQKSINTAALRISAVPNASSKSQVALGAILIIQPPRLKSFNINNGAASTTSRTVTLNNTCTGSPTHYMASGSSSFSGASWQTYSTAPSFTLSSGNGTKTVYLKVKNAAGESSVISDSISLNESTKPSVTWFAINNGAASTTSRTVTLNNTCTGSPTHYMASESSSFSGASWQTYSTAPSFTLSSGNGTKTVYLKVKNAAGESTVISDSIIKK